MPAFNHNMSGRNSSTLERRFEANIAHLSDERFKAEGQNRKRRNERVCSEKVLSRVVGRHREDELEKVKGR